MTEFATRTVPSGLPGARTAPVSWQITVDTADPHAQARFWAAALGYEVEVYEEFIRGLLDRGVVSEDHVTTVDGALHWRTHAAIRQPGADGDEARRPGGRLLFQHVPEPKTTKNRWHLDVHVGAEARAAEVDRLTALGARVVSEHDDMEGRWTIMTDPEGNEFCVA